MIRAAIAATAFTVCCLGNPAAASQVNFVGDDVINNNSRTRNVTRNVDRSTTNNIRNVDRSTRNIDRSTYTHNSDFFQEITVEDTLQHASVPSAPGPAHPDSVAVFTIYGQVDQVGPVAGFSLSMPLK